MEDLVESPLYKLFVMLRPRCTTSFMRPHGHAGYTPRTEDNEI